MNRRKFLASTGVALTAFPAALCAADAPAKSRIRVGFLGASYSHAVDKLKFILASPDWELVGVWDESDAGRETCRKLGARMVPQTEVLDHGEVVFVESDIRDHAKHALLALRAGLHVHVEKPPATTLAEMREIVSLARDKKLLLQTGYMWRHHPGFNAIIEAARQGWFGNVFMVRGHIANNLAAARRPEWAEFKGGGMFEQGSHLLDVMVRLLGRPKNVTPFTRHHGAFADKLNDNNVAVLEFDRALAVLTNSTMQSTPTPARSFEVLGTNGSAVLQPIEPPELKLEFTKAAGPYAAGVQTVPLKYRRYEGDFAEFVAALRGGRAFAVDIDTELLVQETLLRVCGMM
ncbi:MAG: Gfo/Idh/MocA family oxidoreductase [Pedosphaera sp.]|nr:Gfo/Idh/MocA family oxidoreductase [Pedosphaera sp.]